ncbi:MAG TPA: hypothetical protein VG798_01750 [Rhizomicrobium sp.]|nr:hypothetical protein [Rhizomicrobium sp.]
MAWRRKSVYALLLTLSSLPATPALAQRGEGDATNQDDPVRITKCTWLATPKDDTSLLILGSAWAGRGEDVSATRKKAAACVHLAAEAVSPPAPCPGGMIGVMSDQHFTPC